MTATLLRESDRAHAATAWCLERGYVYERHTEEGFRYRHADGCRCQGRCTNGFVRWDSMELSQWRRLACARRAQLAGVAEAEERAS